MAIWYDGNEAGTANSKFQVNIGIDVRETSGNQQHVYYKYTIEVTKGNFYGVVMHRSWGGDISVSGVGYYGDSGWIDAGWKSSGQTFSFSCNCYYTGGSGTTYRSICSASYTVPSLITVPPAPISVTLTKNSDILHTLSWILPEETETSPIESQEIGLKINDEAWAYTPINDKTTTEITLTTTTNSKYYACVHLLNSAGASAWTYSNITYTTPEAPLEAFAIKMGTSVVLQATVSNIKYPQAYQWQRASNSSFSSDLTTLSETDAVILDITTIETPFYRVRCLGQGEEYSDWTVATLTFKPQLLVSIPDGQTIQAVYINIDD